MYEHRKAKPLGRDEFRARVRQHGLWVLAIVAFALSLGISGYHFIAGLSWIDSLLNSSMILGGMGPVDPLPNDASKVFASLYALFAGLVFVFVSGLLIAPFAHRLLHKFHWEEGEQD